MNIMAPIHISELLSCTCIHVPTRRYLCICALCMKLDCGEEKLFSMPPSDKISYFTTIIGKKKITEQASYTFYFSESTENSVCSC